MFVDRRIKMPYSHAGEIGDILKHLPLCEILRLECPAQYCETNSAFAEYMLPWLETKEYGVFRLLDKVDAGEKSRYEYFRILRNLNTKNSRKYFGSPALAMSILGKEAAYCFHDIEQPALDSVSAFAQKAGLSARTVLGDSITAFMDKDREFTPDCLVFIDPYRPFDQNPGGHSFFDIFERLCRAGTKTVLWYGYETLDGQRAMLDRLFMIARSCGRNVHAFDLWQEAMTGDACPVNPGVPGCGLALCNLSDASVAMTGELQRLVEEAYQGAEFRGTPASLKSRYTRM
jgi:23S rRNA (adenine2030-N6)-methyltransferase